MNNPIAKIFAAMMQALYENSRSSGTPVGKLQEIFEAHAFQPDSISGAQYTGTRYVYAIPRVAFELIKIYKSTEFSIGAQRFIIIPCSLLQEPELFPILYAKCLFVIDLEMQNPSKSFYIEITK